MAMRPYLHRVIQDIHRVLVVSANHEVAVPFDVPPGWVQVSAHELQQRTLSCNRQGGGGASASVKLQVNCGLADDCVISIASSSKHTVWSR